MTSDQPLDNALNDIVITSWNAGGLRDISMEVWVSARCAGGWRKSCAADRHYA